MIDDARFDKLNDYLDGELSAAEARAFELELEQDAALRAEFDALRGVVSEAARLPKGAVPSRDLWNDIAPRLPDRTPARRSMTATVYRASLAAAAAVLVFVSGVWYARSNQTSVSAPPVAATLQGETGPQAELASYKQIELDYAGVRASLREALDKARPDLAPETVTVIDDSLVTIDNAIKEIEAALAADPGNRGLIRSLVAVYDQEVGLLRQVTRVSELPGENKA